MRFAARPISRQIAKPRFKHDCTECKFLGSVDGSRRSYTYDMYVCTLHGDFILRFGDEESQYAAMPHETIELLSPGTCYKLAVKLNELKKPPRHYQVVETA